MSAVRKTPYELWRSIGEARRLFSVGSEWQHYGGEVYEITGHGVDEVTGDPEVRYMRALPLEDGRPKLVRQAMGDFPAEYHREIEFHRSVTEFGATVSVGGQPQLRFRPLRRVESFERR